MSNPDGSTMMATTTATTPPDLHVALTAKPHAFSGAILTPKHARELTPSLVLTVTVSLAEQASATTTAAGRGLSSSASVGGASPGSASGSGHVHHGHTPSGSSSVGGIPPAPPSLPNSPPSLGRRASGSSVHSSKGGGAVGSIANADLAFRTIQQTGSTDSGFGGGGGSASPSHVPMSPSACAARYYEHGGTIQYTVWITEAWRVLGWAEPSAALFWEMTTMYYTLYLAGRYHSSAAAAATAAAAAAAATANAANSAAAGQNRTGKVGADAAGGGGGAGGSAIPPILSVGSNASSGSARSAATRPRKNTSDGDQSAGSAGSGGAGGGAGGGGGGTAAFTDGLGSAPPTPRGGPYHADAASVGSSPGRRPASPANSAVGSIRSHAAHLPNQQNKPSGSAKELPVWMIGTYLLLHCEAEAYRRNLSGEDERRFGEGSSSGAGAAASLMGVGAAGGVDFNALLMHTGLSPRTRLHAGLHNDNSHCAAYLLRHLRKFLLLTAVPHNDEAIWALSALAERPGSLDPEYDDMSSRQGYPTLLLSSGVDGAAPIPTTRPDANELLSRHEQEHDVLGSSIRLTLDDLERLSLLLQPPNGGLIDDPPIRIGDLLRSLVGDLSSSAPPEGEEIGAPSRAHQPQNGLLLADVEREIRAHLENELRRDEDEDESTQDSDPTEAMAGLSLRDHGGDHEQSGADARLSRRKLQDLLEESQGYNKELSYTNLRGTTTLLKPTSHPDNREAPANVPSSAESVSSASGGGGGSGSIAPQSNGRLHDLHISDCSDAHMYLLQPFEHATISACTGCTIVVGAVAGLLHVVDCERTTITTAAKRVLVSNCFDVLHCIFTPSPPLLVGDNRSCQFAPYNTYYDGLREDLLATGLAAALLNGGPDLPQPALQCSSNKWKHPVELAKLEIPQLPGAVPGSAASGSGGSVGSPHPSGVGADDKAISKGTDDNMQTPVLLPPSEFHILFVPLESEAAKERRSVEEAKEMEVAGAPGSSSQDDNDEGESCAATAGSASAAKNSGAPMDSQYCRILADVIQLSPFRLPSDYERRALVKAERMKAIQAAMQTLTPAQKLSLEDELNRGFRDWLVTSGNLRQVLDLVHMDRMV
mmetsp:Transcript_7154/g.14964  ORF Transcript_7154/g.14964 Transcript_7154/m.14964 type:complete len:1104 (+) Transcript_7154:272-3583(+)